MLGAIAGDIIVSVYESNNIKTKAFPLLILVVILPMIRC
jgi:hypothetical protein